MKNTLTDKKRESLSLGNNRRRRERFLKNGTALSVKKQLRTARLSEAGMTVEAALVFPLALFFMIAVISMMNLYGAYTEQLLSLQVQAEELGKAASLTEGILPVVDLQDPVTYRVSGIPFVNASVRVACRARVHSWVGRTREESSETGKDAEELVYVTDNREVVHLTSRCSHLSLQIEAVSGAAIRSYRNEDGARYHACEKCVGGEGAAVIVYIGPQGEAYHNDADCGFGRSVSLIKRSEVSGLPVCSRCIAITGQGAAE